jgi:hypothetical protein
MASHTTIHRVRYVRVQTTSRITFFLRRFGKQMKHRKLNNLADQHLVPQLAVPSVVSSPSLDHSDLAAVMAVVRYLGLTRMEPRRLLETTAVMMKDQLDRPA